MRPVEPAARSAVEGPFGSALGLPGGAAMIIDPAIGVTLVSSAVSAVTDASGNGRAVSQGSAGLRPAMTTLNGQPALSFAGQYLDTASLSIAAPSSFLIVLKQGTTTGTQCPIDNPFGTTGRFSFNVTGTSVAIDATYNSSPGTFSLDLTTARTLLVTVGSSTQTTRSNGVQVKSAGAQSSFTWTGFRFGAHVSGGFAWQGTIAYWGVWPRVFSAGEIAQAERYARARWHTW